MRLYLHYYFTDCTAPFLVSVKTDALTDLDSGTTADTKRSRGILTYAFANA